MIDEIDVLPPLDDAESLVESLLNGNAVLKTEPRDAAHIALASVPRWVTLAEKRGVW